MSSRICCLAISGLFVLYLSGFSQSVETIVQTGHYAAVTAVCFSPDGNLHFATQKI